MPRMKFFSGYDISFRADSEGSIKHPLRSKSELHKLEKRMAGRVRALQKQKTKNAVWRLKARCKRVFLFCFCFCLFYF